MNRDRLIRAAMVTALVVCGCGKGGTSFHFDDAPPAAPPGQGHQLTVQLLRRFGTDSGPLAFGGIGPIAVNGRGQLAIADDGSCQVAIVGLESGHLLRRVGRCGSGPGEFRRLGSIDFYGDTLVLFDRTNRAIIWMDNTGREIRRLRPNIYDASGVGLVDRVEQIDDTTLVASLALIPGPPPGPEAGLIAVVDARTGATRARGVRDVPGSIGLRGDLLRSAEMCVAGAGASARVAVANPWAFEGLVVDPGPLIATSHFLTELDQTGSFHGTDRFGNDYVAPSSLASLACTSDRLLLQHALRRRRGNRPEPDGAYLELRDREGQVLGSLRIAAGDTLGMGRPAAGDGERFYYRYNPRDAVPQVMEYRVTY